MEPDNEFADYVHRRWAVLVRSAIFLGARPHEAEDLAQNTLVACYRHWSRVSAAEDRDAYVHRMLFNAWQDSRRRRWWKERPTAEVPEVSRGDDSERIVIADAVHRALANLSPTAREVVVLRHFSQFSEAQTAAILGIRPGTVKSRLSRAMAQLARDAHLTDARSGKQEVTP